MPKAFANFSSGLKRRRRWLISAQRLERSDNPGILHRRFLPTLKALYRSNAFSVYSFVVPSVPGLSHALQPWAHIGERFQR